MKISAKLLIRIVVILIVIVVLIFKYLPTDAPFASGDIKGAENLYGLQFTGSERDSMLESLEEHHQAYNAMRMISLAADIPPSLQFNPIPVGMTFSKKQEIILYSQSQQITRPEELKDLAFYTVRELGELLRRKKITSVELTQLFLERLKEHGPELQCVITITEELALKQARRADEEIALGEYRGPLHGIPYGAKDLLSVKGYKTTWGATPYRDQVFEKNAAVINKLEKAGAVLVVKTTLGALAWGDVWFGGKTKNPWDLSQGSSGSSAGSASATAAGLVPFAIGSETWGSIVSPSKRCGTTGLRPTFGRVSRTGAMALSWSMDKVGPICRTVEDCAIVFDAIRGADGMDQSAIDMPFNYSAVTDIGKLRIGYLKTEFNEKDEQGDADRATLEVLRAMGIDLIAIELPAFPIDKLSFILDAEAAAVFDELTRSNRDDELVRQIKGAWPNVFRTARFIPAVEYIQANRIRYMVIQEMKKLMDKIDVYVVPAFGGANLLLTNLTGHPSVVLPNGFDEKGRPLAITFVGGLYDEAALLTVAKKYQDATDFNKKHPPLFAP